MTEHRYTDNEVRDILKRAVTFEEDDTDFTRDQLFDIGREAGLTDAAIVRAEQDWRTQRQSPSLPPAIEPTREAFEHERRTVYLRNLVLYALFVGVAVLAYVTMGLIVFWLPILVLTVLLVVRGVFVFLVKNEQYYQEWEQWRGRHLRRDEALREIPNGQSLFENPTLHQQFQQQRRVKYRRYALQSLLFVIALALLNFVISPQIPWVLLVLFGIGISIAMRGANTYQIVGEAYERDFIEWLRQRALKRQ